MNRARLFAVAAIAAAPIVASVAPATAATTHAGRPPALRPAGAGHPMIPGGPRRPRLAPHHERLGHQ